MRKSFLVALALTCALAMVVVTDAEAKTRSNKSYLGGPGGYVRTGTITNGIWDHTWWCSRCSLWSFRFYRQ